MAIGLSGGFLEPLESTSIHLIQAAIARAARALPRPRLSTRSTRDEFNRLAELEYEQVRDFLILHYHATERHTPLWVHCREMELPPSLAEKLALFRERGFVVQYKDGLFLEPSWLAVYLGQGVTPERPDPFADRLEIGRLRTQLAELKGAIDRAAASAPAHAAVLSRYCPSAA